MKIYLDTNLWNVLCDQEVSPRGLVAFLAARNASLVLSTHTLYELAKTFRASTEKSMVRGKRLFSYLKEFVDVKTPCAKENPELLAAEMTALQFRRPIEAFLDGKDYPLLSREVEKLTNADFDERAAKFIKERGDFSSNTRLNQVRHLENRADMKQQLKNVPPKETDQWLQRETMTRTGVAILTSHILRQFPEAPRVEAVEYAIALLASATNRMSRGLVRADLYYNWRCAHRNSNPKDLVDDIYHVLNSVYCDVYATEEEKQRDYAGLLLTANTSIAIYDSKTRVDRWLESLH